MGKNDSLVRMLLVESDARKCAFLRDVARRLGLDVEILCSRIERLAEERTVKRFDIVSARALAPLAKLLALSAPLLAASGIAYFPKGRGVEDEIAEARRSWSFDYELHPSLTDPQGRIVALKNLQPSSRGTSQ